MQTKDEKKRATATKTPAQTKTDLTEPFAAVAAPVKKRIAKKAAVSAIAVSDETVKKPVSKRKTAIALDPFAESVQAVSPVKKRPSRTVRAEASSVKTAKKPAKRPAKKATLDVTAEIAANEPKVELSPVFKLLAAPVLPTLVRENRARLQMQTPTRLYFYWSLKTDPWTTLRSVFGETQGSYTLVIKLTDLTYGTEVLHRTDAEGNYWFDAEPHRKYQAEIGFYAPNRPYFRILHSNTVETPRRSPSPRAATESDWTLTAAKFAEVLDVAGFSRDAFDVAIAGDDPVASTDASHVAFAQFLGTGENELHGISAEDIRYAMMALAAGATLESLRFRVSPALFAILQANAGSIEPGKAMNALTEHFDIEEGDFTEEQIGPAVFGASLVNFPRTLKTRTKTSTGTRTLFPGTTSRYNPVSSSDHR